MKKLLLLLTFLTILAVSPWLLISWVTSESLYRDVDTIPERWVGLLLGTTPSVDGVNNLFYTTRIEAAKMLYERGKIHHILVSGDNATASYNEPEAMRKSLLKAWVDESDITLDYAGFRTLDSVVRAGEVFSLTGGFTIISQPFHVERALFLARAHHIDAIGYGSVNVGLSFWLYTYIREIGARWIAVYDVLFGTDPLVLGETEELNGK